MFMKIDNKIKKLNLKYRYLILEREEVKLNMIQYQSDWVTYIRTLEQEYNIDIFKKRERRVECTKSQGSGCGEQINKKRSIKLDSVVKDIYNKIAVMTHPDKTGSDNILSSVFRQATRAKNSNDLISMISLCNDIGIDIPELGNEHIHIMEENIKTIRNQIKSIKNQDSYVWAEADDAGKFRIEKIILNNYK